jgi:hypothetical protein
MGSNLDATLGGLTRLVVQIVGWVASTAELLAALE